MVGRSRGSKATVLDRVWVGWVSRRFGDRMRTEAASNFTASSEIPAFPKSQRKEQQQGLSRTPVLLSGTGIPQF